MDRKLNMCVDAFLFVMIVVVLALLCFPSRAASVTAGGLYFLGDTRAAIAAGVEQPIGSWGGAVITADGLILSTGDWAGAVGIKAKLSPTIKGEIAYAPGLNGGEIRDSWRNIGIGLVFAPPTITNSLSPPREYRLGSIPDGYGMSYSLRF